MIGVGINVMISAVIWKKKVETLSLEKHTRKFQVSRDRALSDNINILFQRFVFRHRL